MSEDNDNDNIVQFGSIKGGKDEDNEAGVPMHHYQIKDFDDEIHEAYGFIIFTPQHVAVMRDTPEGALPLMIFPLEHVKYAKKIDPNQQELPL